MCAINPRSIILRFSALAVLGCVAFRSAPTMAQAPVGSISGTVVSGAGAPLSNIHIGLRTSPAEEARTVATDTRGYYRVAGLAPGVYQIIVAAPGFITQLWTGVMILRGTERVLNFVMRAGDPEQIVYFASVDRQASSTTSGNIDASKARNTPLNGRDWAQLATLQAGVTGVQAGNANGTGNADRGFGAAVSISGARPDQNSYRLDGISLNDYSNGAPGSVLGDNLGIDAVEQVSVLENNYPAEYGRTSGGLINAVTRSGTGVFHGSLYEFLRNSVLDARNYFDGRIPPFKRNQFGGSAGGMLPKDRTFVFGDYEGLRQSLGLTTVDTVPSTAARQGHLSTGTITVDSAVARFLAAFYPLPNGPLLAGGDTGIFNFAGQQVTNEDYFTVRVDRKLSESDSVSGTYMRDSSKTVKPDNFDELLSNIVSGRQVVAVHEQHTFNPTLLNAARLGFSRAVGIEGGVSKVLNLFMLDPSYGFEPGGLAGGVQAVPGVTDFAGAPTRQGLLPSSESLFWNSFQGGNDLSLTRGTHVIKFGLSIERMQDNEVTVANTNGVFRFDSLSNWLTNHPLVFQGMATRILPDVGLRETLFGAYAEDDLRLRKNFTLNAGVRYEMVTVPTEAHNRISNLRNLTDAQPHVGAPFFLNPTLRNFEPRSGFSWNPHVGRTVVRGGFGLFDVLPLPYEFNLSFQRAVPFVRSIYAGDLSPGTFPTGAFQQFASVSNSGLATYVQFNPKRNYVMQWNLGVARELSSSLSLTLSYVGSRGVHQPYRMDNIDMVLPTLTAAGYIFPPKSVSQKLNPRFGRIDSTLWQANSFYDALQADVAKRMSRGLEFQGGYTWGKSIDTLSATEADDAFPNGLFNQLFFDQRTSRGLSDFNIAQSLVVSLIWEVPGAWKAKVPKWALNGWQLGGVYKASTGQPFTPILGGDPLGMKLDQTSEPPDRLPGPGCDTLTNPGDANHYIKTQCLGFPVPSSRWGDLGRNTLIGPGLSKLDFSVFKNNPIRVMSQNMNLQFRAEFFNILNHTNFASPTDNLTVFDQRGIPVPSAGLITSTQTTSREIQLALKAIW